jgi:hypothetical protein
LLTRPDNANPSRVIQYRPSDVCPPQHIAARRCRGARRARKQAGVLGWQKLSRHLSGSADAMTGYTATSYYTRGRRSLGVSAVVVVVGFHRWEPVPPTVRRMNAPRSGELPALQNPLVPSVPIFQGILFLSAPGLRERVSCGECMMICTPGVDNGSVLYLGCPSSTPYWVGIFVERGTN